MTKKKQVGVRFDSNRTRLKTGETQRPNGTYAYRWSTPDGKRHSIYAPTLEKLREQEEQIIVDKHDGIRSDVKSITVNQGNLNKALRRMMRDCNDEILEKYGADSDPVLLPQFSCHILRHTFATRLCESGANLKFIQSILGHADVSTTMNIYVDVTDALKKKEITAFDDYMTTKLET